MYTDNWYDVNELIEQAIDLCLINPLEYIWSVAVIEWQEHDLCDEDITPETNKAWNEAVDMTRDVMLELCAFDARIHPMDVYRYFRHEDKRLTK